MKTQHTTSLSSKFAQYSSLSKLRLSSFVALSGVSGYFMAKSAYTDVVPRYAESSIEVLSQTPVDFPLLFDAVPTETSLILSSQPYSVSTLTCLATGTLLASASANTWNQCTEIDQDSKMRRTWNRMLPKNKVTFGEAVTFGLATGASGVALLSLCNPLTAVLGLANIGLYAAVYTPMKRIHYWNTWVGAFVGGIPPLMGWAAFTGTLSHNLFLTHDVSAFGSDLGGWVLAGILYAWQIPHFLSLSWMHREDYKTAGYAMLSTIPGGLKKVSRVTWTYSLAMIPFNIILPCVAGIVNWWFPVTAGALHIYSMVLPSQKFYNNPSKETARSAFRMTLLYLPMIILLLILHKKNKTPLSEEAREILNDPLLSQFKQKPSIFASLSQKYMGYRGVVDFEESQIVPLIHHVLLSKLYSNHELPFDPEMQKEISRLSYRFTQGKL